jgi:hypothetical protein
MVDSLAQLLLANDLNPDTFTAAGDGRDVFHTTVPAGSRSMDKWVSLAKSAKETKYWPLIIVDGEDQFLNAEHDPATILAATPGRQHPRGA